MNASTVIRLVDLTGTVTGSCSNDGMAQTGLDDKAGALYLRYWDVEAHDGRGVAEWTYDIAKAYLFSSSIDAARVWKLVPVCRPLREDGKPNRPLTAFSVIIEDLVSAKKYA